MNLPNITQDWEPVAKAPPADYSPIYESKVPAGFPSPAQDYLEQNGLDLNNYLIHHKAASFFFNVKGESMVEAGIFEGDKVLVDKSVDPLHNHIVIAIYNNEYTLKRLYIKDGVIELRPENKSFSTIKLCEGDELRIWGVVTAVIRKLSY